jgi:hypothetical protein
MMKDFSRKLFALSKMFPYANQYLKTGTSFYASHPIMYSNVTNNPYNAYSFTEYTLFNIAI